MRISFEKYVLCGNKFVLVDETRTECLAEMEKSRFAWPATDPYFGIGSDNLLCLQRTGRGVLNSINAARGYWSAPPGGDGVDFIFRMFEPDGVEAFSCGNGLTCIAHHLHRKYGIVEAAVMTEIPTCAPRVIRMGTDIARNVSWINMGRPRKISDRLARPDAAWPWRGDILALEGLEIEDHLEAIPAAEPLRISGFLINTGEPHLVIFVETGILPRGLADGLFPPAPAAGPGRSSKVKTDKGAQLIHLIGMAINQDYRYLFPHGLNVNFVRVPIGGERIEYRCFERGINRETWACGTGALACVHVARKMGMLRGGRVPVWPHLCRNACPDAELYVLEKDRDYYLYGQPLHLFAGVFNFEPAPFAPMD